MERMMQQTTSAEAGGASEATMQNDAVCAHDFWYVACESHELTGNRPLARTILGERLALFRDAQGDPVALRDRCMHRSAPLSHGQIKDGCLQCPYHGWTYNGAGEVVDVPCEKELFKPDGAKNQKKGGWARSAMRHEVREEQDYIFVRLSIDNAGPTNPKESLTHAAGKRTPAQDIPSNTFSPFRVPGYNEPGYQTVRLQNLFHNNVLNCAENFIDIPHTVFVHPGIFRKSRGQAIEATAQLEDGNVHVTYHGETDNLGWFRFFLNPAKKPIEHMDHFFMPNITSVEYRFGPDRHFIITSQCVPVDTETTLVFTDLTFNYGIWNVFAKPIVRWQGQKVIDQDLEILKLQMDNIKQYGDTFSHTAADTIHIFVEKIFRELEANRDPRRLQPMKKTFTFWV
jgi:phenylpropionate dioxygenase-like ring-hydroxylating dioxygenase large terminal subunit